MKENENTMINNPAGRLRFIIDKARTVPHNTSVRQGWARVFDVDESDVESILSSIAQLLAMTDEAKEKILSLDGYEHELYLKPIYRIEEVIARTNLNDSWSSVGSSFDEFTIHILSIVNDLLTKSSQETPISDMQLEQLRAQVNELFETVVNSDLPPELKSFISDLIEKIRNALINYAFWGPGRVREAVEQATGAFVLRAKSFSTYWSNPVIKQFLDVLSTIANAFAVYEGARLLVNGIVKLLESGS